MDIMLQIVAQKVRESLLYTTKHSPTGQKIPVYFREQDCVCVLCFSCVLSLRIFYDL